MGRPAGSVRGTTPGSRRGSGQAVRDANAVQQSFADLGTPLFGVTFVVLDLETTGLRPDRDRITEIGAVKVRGGRRLGEFQALVSPGRSIPAGVSTLTGITNELVADCPPIEAVLPMLLEFVRGATIVAHNANFDMRFLQANLARLAYPPLRNPVVDTARLARRVLDPGEVRNHRLATLAHYLHARVKPNHRALPDATATVDVLHGLLERVGSLGVKTLEGLHEYCRSTSDDAYRKVSLVDGAPERPGVYRFLDGRGEVLYVGKTTNLRTRLRRYFGQDRRARIADLVRETAAVTWTVTPTEIEANVREVRAIHQHRPRYNRRSRHPERAVWLKLTRERFPRLSIVHAVRDEAALHVGPVTSSRHAEHLAAAVYDALPLRQCTDRLTATRGRAPCLLKDIGRCGAPCDGTQDVESYAEVVEGYVDAITHDPTSLIETLRRRMDAHARAGRYERAGQVRARLHHLARTLKEQREIEAVTGVDTIVAARPLRSAVEVVRVRRGRLMGSARADGRDADAVRRAVDEVDRRAASDPVVGGADAEHAGAAEDAEEIRLLTAWLRRPNVVVVEVEGTFAEPVAGGGALSSIVDEARRVSRAVRRDRDVLEGRKVARRPV